MDVVVAGGHGQVGIRLVALLAAPGALLAVLEAPGTVGKAFDLVSGDTPVEEAVRNL